jgi:integrase
MSLVPVSGKGLARLFDKSIPKYFTAHEMAMILSEDLRQKDYDSYFLCLFLWNTGVRVSEAVDMKVEDVDMMARAMRAMSSLSLSLTGTGV